MGGSRTHPYANARQVLAVEFAVVFEFDVGFASDFASIGAGLRPALRRHLGGLWSSRAPHKHTTAPGPYGPEAMFKLF